MKNESLKVMFVCMGNICRSPAAEAVLRKLLGDVGLEKAVTVASSGTSAYHSGSAPDPRMIEFGSQRGFQLNSRAQQFHPRFFEEFDLILTMDRANYRNVIAQTSDPKALNKVKPFTHFCCEFDVHEIPDPYYGGDEGFSHVYDLLQDGCNEILRRIQNKEDF